MENKKFPPFFPWPFWMFACGVSFSIAAANIALGLWLLVWVWGLSTGRFRWRSGPLDRPILIFIGVEILTGLLGINPSRSLLHLSSLWHLVIYVLIVNTITEKVWMERGLTVLFTTVGLNASYGILQFFFGPPLYFFRSDEFLERWTRDIYRELGTFSHSMTFAGQMTLVGMVGAGGILWYGSRKRLWPWKLAITVIFLAWVLSYTRSAWVGGFGGLLILGMMKGRRTIGVILGLGAVVVMSISFLKPSFSDRLLSIFDPSNSSNLERINMGRMTYAMFLEKPWTGVGPGNYSKGSEPYRKQFGVISKSHPHNNLFSQLADKGLLGLVSYLFLWIVFFRQAWLGWRNADQPLEKVIAAGGLAALSAFHLSGLFEGNFGDSEVAMMMWLIVGLVMRVRANQQEIKRNQAE